MPAEPHTMQCLEVWGGNRAVDSAVVMPGLDAWVYSRPYRGDEAGGDIHYVSSCASGRITRLLIADVSGHGAGVAGAATALRDLMRRYVNVIDMSRFVEGLNREFGAVSEDGGFATAVAATYWAPTDFLTLCNAGHPRPLWYRERRRAWTLLQDTTEARAEGLANIPLGVAEPTRYDQIGVRLEHGDLVLLYSDSLIEARRSDGRVLGPAGLLRLVSGLEMREPARLVAQLVGAAFAASPPEDDVTVMALRPNGVKARVSVVGGLAAGARLASAFVRSLRPGAGRFPWPEMTLSHLLGAFSDRFNRGIGRR